jgi:DNA-binding transcriptional MerR regulator
LVNVDPALAGRHRYFHEADVLYLGLLKDLLSAGLCVKKAVPLAAAVIYGVDNASARSNEQAVSWDRLRRWQRHYASARPELRPRDARRAYWLVYTVDKGLDVAIVPERQIANYAARHPQFCSINLTLRLATIERGLATLGIARVGSAKWTADKRQRRATALPRTGSKG